MTRRWRSGLTAASLVALGGAISWWWWAMEPAKGPAGETPRIPEADFARTAARRQAERRPGALPRPDRSPAASGDPSSCEPFAKTACYGDDLYWFDSCDRPLELQEDCGEGFCVAGECLDQQWPLRCQEPPEGRCDGDWLKLCDLGRDIAIDCAAKGQVCGRGVEGAGCYPDAGAQGCRSAGPRCDGDVLVRCLNGTLDRLDCATTGGRCAVVAGQVSCLSSMVASGDREQAECGPCGCEVDPLNTVEVCNGADDDQNGFVDDGIDCGPLPVDVLLGTGERGEALLERAELEAEVAQLNAIFAHSHSEIRFELGEVSDLNLPDPSELEFEQLGELLRAERASSSAERLSVRLVFTRRLLEGAVPRLGVALPFVTQACGEILHEGGLRFDHALIVVALGRTATTLAHEIGHFLGLCHTHEANMPGRPPVAEHVDGELESCGEACEYGGDAVCDTPLDNEECRYEPRSCGVACPGPEQPDPTNVMSYYHLCRTHFSADQVSLMEHTLALRRAWFECRNGACGCLPGAEQCPVGMSCRPVSKVSQGFACGMDGPRLPGERCGGQEDCSARSLCLTGEVASRCARSCDPGAAPPGCSCSRLQGSELHVCREDLREDVVE